MLETDIYGFHTDGRRDGTGRSGSGSGSGESGRCRNKRNSRRNFINSNDVIELLHQNIKLNI